MHRILRTLLCSFWLMVTLTACGQKSDLYLPSESARSSTTSAQELILPS
ncbi:lipoprotein [Saccharospirillum sp. HFRX-1]